MMSLNDGGDSQMTDTEFNFLQSLAIHSGTVRCLDVLEAEGDAIVSGSIDTSVKLCELSKENDLKYYQFSKEFTYHEGFIYAVHRHLGNNGFYTASKDMKIMHVDSQGNPHMIFEGHEGAVNSLSQAVPEELLSGSWDGTARIWDTATGKVKHVLEGHTHAVSVLALPNGINITGSQDKTIRIWYKENMQKEIPNAHDDIIRAIVNVPGVGFATCSNDEKVKVWSIEGALLQTMTGHSGFVFTLIQLKSGELASGGDDCQVKIWDTQSGQCKQTIMIPKTVFAVSQNSRGDLIIGGEDYKIRVFTRNPDLKPVEAELKEYEEELLTKTTTTEQNQFANAPDFKDAHKYEGKGDGVQVFKKDGVPCAYMWKAVEKKWELIGEVVDPSAGGGGGGGMGMMPATKQYGGDGMFPPGEYDHIFDVELGDGIMRKLPFNNGTNVIEAAEKFCIRENLSRANVEQIRQFITQHSQPFATRDVSGAGKQQQQIEEKDNTMRQALFYDQVKIAGPQKKIMEFQEQHKFMDPKEEKLFTRICEVLGDPNKYYLTKIDEYDSQLLIKLLEQPIDRIFPCLDLYRIFLLHPDMSNHFKKFEDGASRIYTMVGVIQHKQAGDPAIMLALRCLVNMFKDQSAIYALRGKRELVVQAVSGRLTHQKANIRESAVTVLLNYSIQFLMKDDPEGKTQVLSGLSALAAQKATLDEQSKKRMEVCVTNLTYKNQDGKQLAQSLGLL